jgi:hypothetical protein
MIFSGSSADQDAVEVELMMSVRREKIPMVSFLFPLGCPGRVMTGIVPRCARPQIGKRGSFSDSTEDRSSMFARSGVITYYWYVSPWKLPPDQPAEYGQVSRLSWR